MTLELVDSNLLRFSMVTLLLVLTFFPGSFVALFFVVLIPFFYFSGYQAGAYIFALMAVTFMVIKRLLFGVEEKKRPILKNLSWQATTGVGMVFMAYIGTRTNVFEFNVVQTSYFMEEGALQDLVLIGCILCFLISLVFYLTAHFLIKRA